MHLIHKLIYDDHHDGCFCKRATKTITPITLADYIISLGIVTVLKMNFYKSNTYYLNSDKVDEKQL